MATTFALLASLCLYVINGLILPITKTDGSLDVSSLLSHIALLEQTIENKASAADFNKLEKELRNELLTAQTKITVLETKLNQCSCSPPGTQNSASPSEVTSLQTDVGHLKHDVFQLQSLHNRTSETKGYTDGTRYDAKGGSVTILCLPEHPVYPQNVPKYINGSSIIYGTEYEAMNSNNPFHHLHNEDMPCVVCESSRSMSIMVPGRKMCHPGWTLEYWGYIMGGYPNEASTEYICVDVNPEAIPGGKADENGRTLVLVESICSSLPCPPYVQNAELSCAVCSK